MSQIVHARLDEAARKILVRLRRRSGWTDSEIVRRGLRELAGVALEPGSRKVVGMGKFRSGLPDLGSNKKHLEGFGRE